MLAEDRDWAQLPMELLGSVVERLTVMEYIRFGAVCTSWALVASLYLPLAPQYPFLVLPGDGGPSCNLVTITDGRGRRIAPLPEIQGKWCVGSQDGWLAMVDEDSKVSLLNPLSRLQIHLPSDGRFPAVHTAVDNSNGSISYCLQTSPVDPISDDLYNLSSNRVTSLKKIVLSARPTVNSYTTVAIFSCSNHLAFVSSAEHNWTVSTRPFGIKDVIYSDGQFLAITVDGKLWALHLSGPSPRITSITDMPGWDWHLYDKYLANSSGDLLQIWIKSIYASGDDGHRRGVPLTTPILKLMKLDTKRATWVPLKSLGVRSLFLGLSHAISLSAREITGLKPNFIFFTEVLRDWFTTRIEDQLTAPHVGAIRVKDGRSHFYRPPNTHLKCPPPLWFTPALL